MFRMIWFSVSRARLTVRILRYEIKTGLRAVVFCHKQMGDCFKVGLIIDIQELVTLRYFLDLNYILAINLNNSSL